MRERQQHADQTTDERAVQSNELQIGADPALDLLDELIVVQPLQAFADREADLVMMAANEIVHRGPHPTIERRAAAIVRLPPPRGEARLTRSREPPRRSSAG